MNLKPSSIKKLREMSAKVYFAQKRDVFGRSVPYPRPNYWRKLLTRGTFVNGTWTPIKLRDLVKAMRTMIAADEKREVETANDNSQISNP